jgi:hypothetical protein
MRVVYPPFTVSITAKLQDQVSARLVLNPSGPHRRDPVPARADRVQQAIEQSPRRRPAVRRRPGARNGASATCWPPAKSLESSCTPKHFGNPGTITVNPLVLAANVT